MTAALFKLGDSVRPKPEWVGAGIPPGIVSKIEVWGSEGAIYVEGHERAFAAYVFEIRTGEPSNEI